MSDVTRCLTCRGKGFLAGYCAACHESTVIRAEAAEAERDALRREYVAAFRANMEQTLSRVVIRGEDGTLCPLQKKTDKPGE